MRSAVGFLGRGGDLPEGFGYSLKRRLLGPPMVNEQLASERLSRPLALGVLSCDGISSAAYGTEEILIEMLPIVGVAAFTLILPMTLVILAGIALVVLSYREVVSVYTRAGGSYVVARDNFGPRVAQVAAVALLIDYIVTVAVQTAAGSAAIVSAFPQLDRIPVVGPRILLVIAVLAVLIMCYGNLRGIREAGKAFALPTYLFSGSVALMIIVGLIREVLGDLHHVPHFRGETYHIGHSTAGLLSLGMIYMLLRAFANGGSSLTGIEAVSNAVSALRPPEGRNARQILITQGSIVAFLIAGISWLSHVTHAIPYLAGYPTVLAQEADVVFGSSAHFMYYVVQLATALILFTGGNTSFSGFPFLASFVAEDSFLPRWLTKRGHRLVFSNGIIVLTVVSLTLLLAFGATVNALVPLYAIGVFTGFAMAGFGMARYHRRTREQAWRRRLAINLAGGIYTAVVVVIFAVVKFTEGAWLIVILFPVLVIAFIRLNREYRTEAEVLQRIGGRPKPPSPPNYPRRTVFLLVDSFDLATIAALRYARSLKPTTLRAVHFVIDTQQADQLREEWMRADRDVVLDFIDAPDRRLARAAAELVSAEAAQPGTQVTVVLPRRSYSPLLGRLLHDRTADKIAAVVSRIPNAAATIIPFDVRSRLEVLHARQVAQAEKAAADKLGIGGQATEAAQPAGGAAAPAGPDGAIASTGAGPAGPDTAAGLPPVLAEQPSGLRRVLRRRPGRGPESPLPAVPTSDHPSYDRPAPSPGVNPIGSLARPGRATVEGRVRGVEIRPVERNSVLAVDIADSTGDLTALFYGRSHIPGLVCGARVRFRGSVGVRETGPVMINPAYELLSPGTSGSADGEGPGGASAPRRGRRPDGPPADGQDA
jgi:amino acid transporter